MILEACPSSLARIHEVSSSVPLYPDHWTRQRSLHACLLSNFELRISEILYSGSSSMITGGGGG
jgi:hypothetical protein